MADANTDPVLAAEFWAEQRAIRERREQIAAMPTKLEQFEAHLQDAYKPESFEEALFGKRNFPYFDAGEALDMWLAEDGRVFEVHEALGLKLPWEETRWQRLQRRFRKTR